MKYFEKDKAFKIMFIIYLIALAADLVSTLRLGILVKYLEANPLLKFGGLPLIMLLNLVFAGAFYYCYSKGKVNARFFVLYSMIAIVMTRVIAIKGNLAVAANPPSLAQAMAVTQAMRTEVTKRWVLVNIFPFLNGAIAWMFFREDHKIERKC